MKKPRFYPSADHDQVAFHIEPVSRWKFFNPSYRVLDAQQQRIGTVVYDTVRSLAVRSWFVRDEDERIVYRVKDDRGIVRTIATSATRGGEVPMNYGVYSTDSEPYRWGQLMVQEIPVCEHVLTLDSEMSEAFDERLALALAVLVIAKFDLGPDALRAAGSHPFMRN